MALQEEFSALGRRRQQVRGCHPSPSCPRGGVPPPPQRGERSRRCQPQGAQARRDSPVCGCCGAPSPGCPRCGSAPRPSPSREQRGRAECLHQPQPTRLTAGFLPGPQGHGGDASPRSTHWCPQAPQPRGTGPCQHHPLLCSPLRHS